MSLLGQGRETVTVYAEEPSTDADGNNLTRPSKVGAVVKASVQPISSTENADGGANTTSRYRLRLVGRYSTILGSQSQVEWRGKRYAIDGPAMIHNSSPRTCHVEYAMMRAWVNPRCDRRATAIMTVWRGNGFPRWQPQRQVSRACSSRG